MCGSEQLVLLIRAARDDASVREPLRRLLAMDDVARVAAIERWVRDGVAAGAPVDLMAAIAWLADDDVAHQAKDVLGL
ncbi:MAG: hypothetical protein KKD25_09375 [Gammaproteobacteria bacterium]|jgi:hypothetical protein|nr:hypothetical protein [Gammaproteobacteria bacterium]MBU0772801.1 hypothetical protein [Gammaproteobacteria bacterium]MBU0856535.1 hypothetical protein [Gammaproteobacteria bacterium]MBU1847571.1 hypothetical protein [Gammaproteobacteria bacterium]